MPVDAGTAYVRVLYDKAGDAAVLGSFKHLIGGLAALFAGEKIFDFGKEAVEAAAQTQKATENIKAQFGSAAKSVLDFGDQAATSFGIGKGASEQFASQMGLVGTNLGLTKKQTADMTIGFEKLSGSVGLIKGQDPTSYFHSLQQALLGNTRGLKQMGISVDTTREKQYLFNKGIISSTKDAITPAQKAMAIYGIATQHLGKFQDEARKHSGDLADSQIKLHAEMQNLEEEIGAALLPAVTKLAGFFARELPVAIAYVTKEWKDHRTQVVAVASAIWNFVKAISSIAWSGLLAAIKFATNAWNEHRAAVLHVVNDIIAIVRRDWPEVQRIILKVMSAIEAIVKKVWPTIRDVIKTVTNIIADNIRAWSDIIHGRWGDLWNQIRNIVKDALNGILTLIGHLLGLAGQAMVAVGKAMLTGIGHGLSNLGGFVAGKLHAILDAIGGFIASVASKAEGLGLALVNGVINGLSGLASAVYDKIKSAVSGHVTVLGVSVPYATGGLVDGGSPAQGDVVLARLTPGEMVLNEQQQARLYHVIFDAGNVKHEATVKPGSVPMIQVTANTYLDGERITTVVSKHQARNLDAGSGLVWGLT